MPTPQKKKIIHLIQSLDIGGCEKVLLRILPLLKNFDHTIITIGGEGALDDKFKEAGINVVNIGQKNLFGILSYFKLIKIIKKLDPGTIMTYLFHADFIGRIILKPFTNKKIISYLVTTYNFTRYWPARLFERLTQNISDGYVAISESVKNFYVEKLKVKSEKIFVIPSGLNLDEFQIKNPADIRSGLGISSDDIVIACVANLHINKGHRFLIEAFEMLFEEDKKVHLLIAGDGDEKENLIKQSSQLMSRDSIHFLGTRNDVPLILKNSDIFALPSFFEGMSTAIMEAMASGLAVAASNIPENKDMLEDMANGILFVPGNSNDIYKKLQTLTREHQLRLNLGEAARSFVSRKYNIQIIATRWEEFFSNLMR